MKHLLICNFIQIFTMIAYYFMADGMLELLNIRRYEIGVLVGVFGLAISQIIFKLIY